MKQVALGPVTAFLALGFACGLEPAPAPAPELRPVDPAIEATVDARPELSEPPPGADVGPGGVPEPVVAAVDALFSRGRRVRCEAIDGLDGEGGLEAVWLGPQEEHLRAPTLEGGWFAAVVPVATGKAIVLRGGRAVGELTWRDAYAGGWAECALQEATSYQLLGVVTGPDDKELPGVTVRGCLPGQVTTTNDAGRFELSGVAHRDCPIVAILEDPEGLGKSETRVVRSAGADVIAEELVVPGDRLAVADVSEQAKRLHGVLERQLRNGVQAEREGFARAVGEAALSAAARAIADRWLADLDARVAAAAAVIAPLEAADKEGLVAFWLRDI